MYRKVLVPLSGYPCDDCVLARLRDLVGSDTVEEIVLIHVVDAVWEVPVGDGGLRHLRPLRQTILEESAKARLYLECIRRQIRRLHERIRIEVLVGKPEAEIPAYAGSDDSTLVLLGTRSRFSLRKLLYGSVASKILSRCKTPLVEVEVSRKKEFPRKSRFSFAGTEAPGVFPAPAMQSSSAV